MSSISSSIEHYTGSVSKGSEGTSTKPADNSTQDDDMYVCNCKQILNQVKQLKKEAVESRER